MQIEIQGQNFEKQEAASADLEVDSEAVPELVHNSPSDTVLGNMILPQISIPSPKPQLHRSRRISEKGPQKQYGTLKKIVKKPIKRGNEAVPDASRQPTILLALQEAALQSNPLIESYTAELDEYCGIRGNGVGQEPNNLTEGNEKEGEVE